MDDLEDFMEETESIVTLPKQFDEVVDIIVNEQRQKGQAIVDD